MFDSEFIALTERASDLLSNAEATTGELPREDIHALLSLKFEADKLSQRVDRALTHGEVPA